MIITKKKPQTKRRPSPASNISSLSPCLQLGQKPRQGRYFLHQKMARPHSLQYTQKHMHGAPIQRGNNA